MGYFVLTHVFASAILKNMNNKTGISIFGDGGWGTTLAIILAKKGYSVILWSPFREYAEFLDKTRENRKFLPGFKIPQEITITSDISQSLRYCQVVIIAIPSKFLRSSIKGLAKFGIKENRAVVISAAKGIEIDTFKRPSEIIKEEAGISDVVVLSGPTIAPEIAQGLPASCVVASRKDKNAKQAQELLMSERFRVYTNSDVVGVELGGAFKNIIAIAAGLCDGLKLGTNAKSALFSRGLVEMKRLGIALGAKEKTFNGLSGAGDLVTTCISPYSRNRHIGEEIARGKKLADILKTTEMIAEGVETARAVYKMSKRLKIELPITEQVYKVLFEDKNPILAVNDLMTRTKKSE
jgi:glycerol-3-phosphate dehydrogenase (NAD(P)+)